MVASLGEAVVLVGADTSGFKKDVAAGVDSGMKAADSSLKSLGSKATATGSKLSLGLTTPILGIGIAAIKIQGEFEQSMNVLQQTSGASNTQMENLSATAKKLGADTVFSAGEAADAMLELAKGGFKPAQIAGGGVQATMALAATEGLNLADAATITSNAMNTFSIKADKASTIADALAGASNASSSSVASLSQALSQVGPGATNAGLSLNETVAVLAAFSNAGINGSDAGTSLKTMLTRLVPTTKKASEEMEHLGLKFTDAKGQMLPITEVADRLQKGLHGLSDEQRTTALATIFGSDATRAATVLAKEGAKGLEGLIAATNKNGAAQALADARMKGTAGALEKMRGSIETAMLAMGEALAPAVVAVANVISNLASVFANLSPRMQTFIAIAAAVAAALGPLLVAFGFMATGLAAISLPVVGVVAALAALGAAMMNAWKHSDEFRDHVTSAWQAINGVIADVVNGIKQTVGGFIDLFTADDGVSAFAERLDNAFGNTGKFIPGLQQLGTTLLALKDSIVNGLGQVLPVMANTFSTVVLPAIKSLVSYITTNMLPIFNQVAQIFATQVIPLVVEVAKFIYGDLYPAIIAIAVAVAAKLQPVFDALIDVFRTDLLPTISKLIKQFREWWPSIQVIIKAVVKVSGVLLGLAATILGAVLPPLIRFVGFVIATVVPAIGKFIGITISIIAFLVKFGTAIATVVAAVVRFAAKVIAKIGEVVGFFLDLPRKILGAVAGFGGLLVNAGKDLIMGLIHGIGSMAGALKDALLDLLPGPLKKFAGKLGLASPSKLFRGFGVNIGEGLVLGLGDTHRSVTSAAGRLAQAVSGPFTAALTPVGTPRVSPVSMPTSGLRGPQITAQPSPLPVTATHAQTGAQIVQNFYGPTTSGDRRIELEWLLKYGTGVTPGTGGAR